MSDNATLGIAVDSSSAKAAVGELNQLTAASQKAEAAVAQLAQAGSKSDTALRAMQAAAQRAGVSVEEYRARTAKFNAESEKMATASNAATGAMDKLQAAAKGFASGGVLGGLTSFVGSATGASLILQGITAAASAYYALTATNAPQVEATLAEQARLVGAIKDAYRDAADKAGTFHNQSKAILELQTSQNINALQSSIRDQSYSFLRAQVPVTPQFDPAGNPFGQSTFDTGNMGPFKAAYEELASTIAQGAPAIEKFRNAIADIGNANPALAAVANQILTASQEAGIAADKVKDLDRSLRLLQSKATPEDRDALGLSNRVPRAKAPARDPFDSAVISANRHIAAMKADALAVGENVGVHARLRTEAQLLEAAQQKGTAATAAQVAKLKEIGQAAADAAIALERARVGDRVSFGRATALLSPEDAQIAAQLRGLYPDVATALDSLEASGLRANAALSGMSATMSNSLTSGFADMLDGTKSLSQGFGDMSKTFARAMEEMLIKYYLVAPLMRGLQGGLSAIGGSFGFADGGLVPGKGFASGGYTGAGGKYQPAGIVHAGEFVFSQASVDRIGVANLDRIHRGYADGGFVSAPAMPTASNAMPVKNELHFHNAPPVASQNEQTDSKGNRRVDVVFADAVAGALQQPQVRRAAGSGGLVRR